jgi:AcrR family transcriptional regulator
MWSSLAVVGKTKKAEVDEAERLRLERKAARQLRRRDEIVRIAVEIAAKAGPDGFTAEDVAGALQMSTPSVFYYFPGGLAELRAAVAVHRFWSRLDPEMKKVEAAPSGVEALEIYVRTMLKVYVNDVDGVGKDFEIMQRGSWGPELVKHHIEKINAQFTVVEKKLEADRAAGKLHPEVENLRRMTMLMNQVAIGLVVGDQLRRKAGGTSKHALDALVDDFCGLLRRGLRKK